MKNQVLDGVVTENIVRFSHSFLSVTDENDFVFSLKNKLGLTKVKKSTYKYPVLGIYYQFDEVLYHFFEDYFCYRTWNNEHYSILFFSSKKSFVVVLDFLFVARTSKEEIIKIIKQGEVLCQD